MAKKTIAERKSFKIRNKDVVMIVAGKERGSRAAKTKRGKVLRVMPDKERVLVERLNFIKRHSRPSRTNRQGGIIEREGAVHISNVMLVCPACDQPTRVGYTFLNDGRKVRICKRCNEKIDK
ncbi:MAG: 50S ribosomal protein L24 [Candidatus Alcyoniella australis]|nr:50S ribosomal protein L24 [Candidatus Alcyoniella australis]